MASSNLICIDDDIDVDNEDVQGLDDISFGSFKADIVGIRYYKGRVNTNEMVSLVREPHNPYDCNAIKVNNVFGVQVGHIKREQAKVLARIVDRNRARLEGVVPFGVQNIYSMPCYISLLGKEADKDSVTTEMRRAGYQLTERQVKRPKGHYESSGPGQNMNVSISSMKVSPQAMKKEMDNLFMKLTENTKTSSQEPAEAIKTSLLAHQKQALAWMMSCENDDTLPPFWEQRGPQDFFNSATNFSAPKKPKSIKGGILADDMGLGKTLQIIALIITNFKNGQNLVTIDKTKPLMLKSEIPQTQKKRRRPSKAKSESFMEIPDGSEGEDEAKLPELPSFTSKDDPEFKINDETLTETTQTSRRSKRATKRPAKYTFDDEDGEGDADAGEAENEEGKASKKEKTEKKKRRKDETKQAPQVIEIDDAQIPVKETFEVQETPEMIEINDSQIPVEETVEVNASAEVKSTTQLNSAAETQLTADAISEVEIIPQVVAAKKRQSKTPRRNSKASQIAAMEGETVETYKGKRAKASGARATLIVCPLSVLSNWQDQLASHVWPGLLDVYTYYGSDRIKECDVLAKKDIVLTTYQTLSHDFNKKTSASPLQTTKWLRVVLDEGHCIRNPNALQSKATHALNAERRWIVTGTPIQNSMKDLWSLICFLKIEPFIDRQWWTRVMERPIKQGEKDALVRLQQLMKCIAIRRTKDQKIDGKPVIELPPKNIYINYIELSPEERDVYQALAEKGKTTIGKYMKAGTLLNNYGEVLVILTRLRQLCCHPKLCTAALEAAAKEAVESSTPEELRKKLTAMIAMVLSSGVDEECSICLDSLNHPVITHCAHIYCRKCIENVIGLSGEYGSRCPLCRGQIALDKLVEPPADQEDENDYVDANQWNSSAKVDALMLALEKQRQTDPSVKCLVVSQFTKFLNLLKHPLEGRGFHFVTLDGSMSQEKRANAIRSFSDIRPGSPTVFLISLKAGGVGLNLSAATKVYLMDPAWNPAAEDQCFDRCHRLGQTKAVDVFKFVVKNSIEERMLDMQEKKRKLMTGAFAKQTAEVRRQQRINDVTVLMN